MFEKLSGLTLRFPGERCGQCGPGPERADGVQLLLGLL